MDFRKKLIQLAKSENCAVRVRAGREIEVLIEAPRDHHFDGRVHELVIEGFMGETAGQVYERAYDKFVWQHPILPCESNCEYWATPPEGEELSEADQVEEEKERIV
jgi:hypothetical protein